MTQYNRASLHGTASRSTAVMAFNIASGPVPTRSGTGSGMMPPTVLKAGLPMEPSVAAGLLKAQGLFWGMVPWRPKATQRRKGVSHPSSLLFVLVWPVLSHYCYVVGVAVFSPADSDEKMLIILPQYLPSCQSRKCNLLEEFGVVYSDDREDTRTSGLAIWQGGHFELRPLRNLLMNYRLWQAPGWVYKRAWKLLRMVKMISELRFHFFARRDWFSDQELIVSHMLSGSKHMITLRSFKIVNLEVIIWYWR